MLGRVFVGKCRSQCTTFPCSHSIYYYYKQTFSVLLCLLQAVTMYFTIITGIKILLKTVHNCLRLFVKVAHKILILLQVPIIYLTFESKHEFLLRTSKSPLVNHTNISQQNNAVGHTIIIMAQLQTNEAILHFTCNNKYSTSLVILYCRTFYDRLKRASE